MNKKQFKTYWCERFSKEFFKTTMTFIGNKEYIEFVKTTASTDIQEMIKWIDDKMPSRATCFYFSTEENEIWWCFKDKQDALLFKLHWN
jgi:hypothetical protein